MAHHLIYHPKRCKAIFGETTVYYDKPSGNHDPYVWNKNFLHTFCHMTELVNPCTGDVQFWVSGDRFPDFSALTCDLVFKVQNVCEWEERNSISATDAIVDTALSYEEHYRWAHKQPYTKRVRKTLKAHPTESFQPQSSSAELIDILPFLKTIGLPEERLRVGLIKGFASKPLLLDDQQSKLLYDHISRVAPVRLIGSKLEQIRKNRMRLPR